MTEQREEPDELAWPIGAVHPEYGEVQMMGITGGEQYRWFCKDNIVSMIPLSVLPKTGDSHE